MAKRSTKEQEYDKLLHRTRLLMYATNRIPFCRAGICVFCGCHVRSKHHRYKCWCGVALERTHSVQRVLIPMLNAKRKAKR